MDAIYRKGNIMSFNKVSSNLITLSALGCHLYSPQDMRFGLRSRELNAVSYYLHDVRTFGPFTSLALNTRKTLVDIAVISILLFL